MITSGNTYFPLKKANLVFLLALPILLLLSLVYSGTSHAQDTIEITQKEQAWLDKKHIVRVRVADWIPYLTITPEIGGISVDYLKLIGERIGINFQFIKKSESWPEAMQDVATQQKKYDLLPTMHKTVDREKLFLFSDDYLSIPWVIFTRIEEHNITSMEDLQGKNLPVPKGYAIRQYLEQHYPNIHIITMDSNRQILESLAKGEVDAFIGNLTVSSLMIRKFGYTNLKVAAPTTLGNHTMATASRKDWPELASLISKGFSTLTQKDKGAIKEKWLDIRYEHGIKIEDVLFWVSIILVPATIIILILARSQYQLKQQIQRRRQAENSLTKNESIFDTLLSTTRDGFWRVNDRGSILDVNDRYCELSGYTREEILRLKISDLENDEYPEETIQHIEDITQNGTQIFQSRHIKKDGSAWNVEISTSFIGYDEENIGQYCVFIRDITERKLKEEEIWKQANFDPLTGLANRVMMYDRLHQALGQARRTGKDVGLIFLDLDGFKEINDTLGHDVGDKLLIEVSRRLQISVRESDTVARLGGDEFTVIAADLKNTGAIRKIGEKIVNILREPFVLENELHQVSGSVGISVFPNDARDLQTLLRFADIAMYNAKQSGKNQLKFYSQEMEQVSLARKKLEQELHTAVKEKQFVMHYQPVIDIDTRELVGVEALIRWRHPEQGLLLPLDFIPTAEITGLINDIGEWVLHEAAKQWRKWVLAGFSPGNIAVNVSSIQFQDPRFSNIVAKVINQYNIPDGHLSLEITESLFMEDTQTIETQMLEIKKLGVTYALDDFGTGFSSISYLKRFPIDVVKIDRSFIHDCPQNKSDVVLVEAVVQMAHSLDLNIIAEGVETRQQKAFLKDIGCDCMQGILISKAVTAQEIEPILLRYSNALDGDISSLEERRFLAALRQNELDIEEWLYRLVKVKSEKLMPNISGKAWEQNGLNLKSAIEAHLKWRIQLNELISGKVSRHEIDIFPAHSFTACDLGKWIANLKNDKSHSCTGIIELDIVHQEFHHLAGEIVDNYASGNHQMARRALKGLKFRTSSKNVVINLIDCFKALSVQSGVKS